MVRLLYVLITFVCCSSSTFSQSGSLYGLVKDANGNPLPGASIYVHDIKTGTISDSLGHYKIQSLPSGTYLIEVGYLGFSSITEAINIAGNVEHDFILEESVVEHQGVIVTGVATATKLRQATQPVTLIRRNDLLKTISANIIDALAKEPGISSFTTGPAIAKPVIRGLGYNRIIVINDGIKQEGQQWGDEHGIEIDEYSVQRAEILKGPASLMYGSDAMAGVINLMSNVPVERGTVKGNIFGSYMNNNELFGVNATLAGHSKSGFNWNFYGSHKSAGDYNNKYDGSVLNSRFNEKNFGGYIGLNKNWGYSHLLVSQFNQQTGLIEGERDAATGKFILYPGTPLERVALENDLGDRKLIAPYQHIRHFKIAVDNNIRLPKGRINFLVGYQNNKRQEYGDATNIQTPGLYFDLNTINYNFQYHSPASKGKWATSVGINGMVQQNKNLAEEVLIPEYKQFDIGTFLFTKKSFENYTISGGLRGDIRTVHTDELQESGNIKFSSFSKTFSNISGSVGLSYDVNNNLTFKTNIARGFRAPNIAELSSNGTHEGTNRYEYGQQDLKSETSFQVDAGLDFHSTHFGLSVAAFYNNISNYIFYRKLTGVSGNDSIIIADGEALTAFRFDQSAASLYGFEISFDVHPHPLDWLHFENNFSYVRGEFHSAIDGSDNLPFMPPAKWNSEVRTDFKKAGRFRNIYMRLEMEHVFSQEKIFSTYNTETTSATYTIFNFGLGADISNKNATLFSLHLALNNFADVAYQSHLSRLKYTAVNNVTGRQGVFNMGRNLSLKLNVPLSFKTK
jgi:iron complex outermembrane recepter protein